jgi:acetoin utilization protein AcuB|tara:strand:- start:21298 stop:21960 length:663 start_codon:yes stop_codon:yes gene_type:complete
VIAKELISVHIPSISFNDEAEKALTLMDENKVSHIPVVDNGEYHGLISENEILDLEDIFLPLNQVRPILTRPSVKMYDYIYDILSVFSQNNITALPVLDDNDQYIGVIGQEELVKTLAKLTNAKEPGGVIVLGLNIRDYSMVQIAQIIESENAKILSSYTSTQDDSLKMDIVLKINKSDLSSILASFTRYDYEIKASFHESEYEEDLERRYNQFIKYLNI